MAINSRSCPTLSVASDNQAKVKEKFKMKKVLSLVLKLEKSILHWKIIYYISMNGIEIVTS